MYPTSTSPTALSNKRTNKKHNKRIRIKINRRKRVEIGNIVTTTNKCLEPLNCPMSMVPTLTTISMVLVPISLIEMLLLKTQMVQWYAKE